jgi:methyltransferase (TIGR00027 family)
MEERQASRTAYRVALRRAAHQVLDAPLIFTDPLALRVVGLPPDAMLPEWREQTTLERVLRASLAARSRFAEDRLHAAVRQGVDQYVVLGAGLDTFACRTPYSPDVLQVFEVDHPTTQAWKRTLLAQAGIPIPQALIFAPVDFETQTLADGLRRVGFAPERRAFFSWLGVTMYLTIEAVNATLQFVASLPPGSTLVFDYLLSPDLLSPAARKVFDGLAQRVALAGEPMRTFFEPPALHGTLRDMGFSRIEDLPPEAMDSLYFQGRTDNLRVGRLAHLLAAQV